MAQGAGKFADGVYSRHPWTAPAEAAYPPQEYIGPFQSNQERLVSQSLAVNRMTGQEIQQIVRPPMPQVAELFPDKYGYSQNEYGVKDIIQISRNAQRTQPDFSQTPNTQESTSTNSLGGTI
jgi:hypothetical protein